MLVLARRDQPVETSRSDSWPIAPALSPPAQMAGIAASRSADGLDLHRRVERAQTRFVEFDARLQKTFRRAAHDHAGIDELAALHARGPTRTIA